MSEKRAISEVDTSLSRLCLYFWFRPFTVRLVYLILETLTPCLAFSLFCVCDSRRFCGMVFVSSKLRCVLYYGPR